MELDDVIGDHGAEDEGEIVMDREGFRRGAEVEVKNFGYLADGSRGGRVRLGDPENHGGDTSGQRPNNRAAIIYQETVLKLRTGMVGEVDGDDAHSRPPLAASMLVFCSTDSVVDDTAISRGDHGGGATPVSSVARRGFELFIPSSRDAQA